MRRTQSILRRAAVAATGKRRWRTAAVGYALARRVDRAHSARWHYGLGWTYEQRSLWAKAARAYAAAAAEEPGEGQWHFRLGWAREHLDDWVGASQAYESALEITPDPAARMLYRAGVAKEHLGLMSDAQAHYEGAIARDDSRGQWHYRLARVREAQRDWEGTIAAYEDAISRDDQFAAPWLGRLAAIHVRRNDPEAAAEAYVRAASFVPEDPTWLTQAALALSRGGRWSRAATLLARNLEVHPDDPRSHYLLGRQHQHRLRWMADLTPTEHGDALTLEPISGEDAVRARELAVSALHRAVELRPSHGPWWFAYAQALEAAERWDEAFVTYESALELLDQSDDLWAFRSRHAWQFAAERARAIGDVRRVEDPLFDGVAMPTGDTGGSPPGLYEARFAHNGLKLTGYVLDRDTRRVEIYLDDTLLRQVNVNSDAMTPRFSFSFKRSTLQGFPQSARLSVLADGSALSVVGGGDGIDLNIPHGDDTLLSAVGRGAAVNKKGMIAASDEKVSTRQLAYLETYAAVKEFFENEIGRPPFLLYGTLLGYHRDGRLLPSDDDFDSGYISGESDPVAVKEETKGIIVRLVRAGFVVSFNRRGRLFRLQTPASPPGIHIDIRPLWFQDGRAWVHNYASVECERADFEPLERGKLRGTEVLVPRNPEVFLRAHYGPGWKVPDPGFRYYVSEVDPVVIRWLAKALITPGEARELRERIRATDPEAVSRYTPIGLTDLYPLDPGVG